MFQSVSIIERQLFTLINIAKRDEPYLAFDILGLAIGIAGMIGEAGNIPFEVAIEIPLAVELEDIDRADVPILSVVLLIQPAGAGLLLGNHLAQILDNVGVLGYSLSGE